MQFAPLNQSKLLSWYLLSTSEERDFIKFSTLNLQKSSPVSFVFKWINQIASNSNVNELKGLCQA